MSQGLERLGLRTPRLLGDGGGSDPRNPLEYAHRKLGGRFTARSSAAADSPGYLPRSATMGIYVGAGPFQGCGRAAADLRRAIQRGKPTDLARQGSPQPRPAFATPPRYHPPQPQSPQRACLRAHGQLTCLKVSSLQVRSPAKGPNSGLPFSQFLLRSSALGSFMRNHFTLNLKHRT